MTAYHNEAIDRLADFLINEVDDLPEISSLLHGVMTPIDFEHLCQKIEICEIHFCDYRICQDDLDNCPSGADAKLERNP